MGPSSSVAVIDIGSNSIKVLVAIRNGTGQVCPLFSKSLDTRISRAQPELSAEVMARGLSAIKKLIAAAKTFSPSKILLVATSAIRDATNGLVFRDLVEKETGQSTRILNSEEEANGIGCGLIADPALSDLKNFYAFDLGGGSLECLAFRSRRIEQAMSFRLGCVRLTEKFVADSTKAIPETALHQIAEHTRTTLSAGNFRFDLPESVPVATGGTVTALRTVLGLAAEKTPFQVTTQDLRATLDRLAALPLPDRQETRGLPAARADVFPTALATLLAVAKLGSFRGFRHSFFNLRYGLAANLLNEPC